MHSMLAALDRKHRKFCVINCENSKAWSPIAFSDMFIAGLQDRDSSDEWTGINVANGDPVPDILMCQELQGIVLTGSRFNVRDGHGLPWFKCLCELIVRAASTGSPRIYGGCFGCQIIAHALGGIVDFNPGERFLLKAETIEVIDNFENYLLSPSFSSSFSPSSTFDKCGCLDSDVEVDHKYDNTIEGGVRDLHLKTENVGEINDEEVASERTERILREKTENEKELEIIFANKLNEIKDSKKVMKSYNIIVSHGDCVCALPPKALLLGSSMSCTNEMYVTGVCGNIFGCQSHPEFHYDYAIKERIWKSVVHLNKKLTEDELRIAKDTFALYSRKDSDELLQLIRKFLCVSHCKRNI